MICSATAPEGATPWAQPIPFSVAETPRFPAELLPSAIQRWVLEKAEETQTPADLPASVVIATVAAACAKAWEIEVRPGWREPLNLWLAPVLPPAVRATSVFESATDPLQRHQAEAAQAVAERNEMNRTILEVHKKKRAAAIAKAGRAESEQECHQHLLDVTLLEADIERLSPKPIPQFLTKDATPAAVIDLLAANGGRIAVISSEGGQAGRLTEMAKKNRDGDLDLFLSAHAKETLHRNRAHKAVTVIAPALTLGVRLHPDRLRDFQKHGPIRESGLRARFLFLMPDAGIGYRHARPTAMQPQTAHAYEGVIRSLLHQAMDRLRDHKDDPIILTLTDAARNRIEVFSELVEERMREGGDLHWISDWAGKIVGHAARLAAVLHLAGPDRQECDVPERTVRDAVRMADDYFVPHARAVLIGETGDPAAQKAKVVVDWIRRKKLRSVTKRDVHRAHQTRFVEATDTAPILDVLIEHHVLRAEDDDRPATPGRPRSPTFLVNPAVHARADDRSDRTDRTPRSEAESSFVSHMSAHPAASREDVQTKSTTPP